MGLKKKFCGLIVLTGIALTTTAQNSIRLKFNKIGVDQGLSSYNIKRIVEDNYSFAWMATQDGLNRFDGTKIFEYKPGKGKFEISGNDIWDIQLDTARNLVWVAAYNSIDAIHIPTGQIKSRLTAG